MGITLGDVKSLDALPEKLILYSERGIEPVKSVLVKDIYQKGLFKNGNTIDMVVKDLPRGVYFLHIIPKENSQSEVEKIRIVLQ